MSEETDHHHLLTIEPICGYEPEVVDLKTCFLLDLTASARLGILTGEDITGDEVAKLGRDITLAQEEHLSPIIIYQSDDGRGENREPGARTGIAPGHIFVIAKVAPGEKGAAIGTKLKSHIERSKYIETVLNYKINLKKGWIFVKKIEKREEIYMIRER